VFLVLYLWQNLYSFSAIVRLLRGDTVENKIKLQKSELYKLVDETRHMAFLVIGMVGIGILFQAAGLFLLWQAMM
jgi:hypothetical protein